MDWFLYDVISLIGTVTALCDNVPTAVLGSIGVNKKEFRGDTTVMLSYKSRSRFCSAAMLAQPVPRITSFGLWLLPVLLLSAMGLNVDANDNLDSEHTRSGSLRYQYSSSR